MTAGLTVLEGVLACNVQLFSDIHLEYLPDKGRHFFETLDPVGVDVLVIAGDFCELKQDRLEPAIRTLCLMYPHVVMVDGNHSFFDQPIQKSLDRIQYFKNKYKNMHWLECETWTWQNEAGTESQRFVGCTGWFPKPFKGVNMGMPDFRLIPEYDPWIYEQHANAVKFLSETIEPTDVVVTHHLPHINSEPREFRGGSLSPYFLSQGLVDVFAVKVAEGRDPKLWLHGHSHRRVDHKVGNTRVVCNPLGYVMGGELSTYQDTCILLDGVKHGTV